MIVDLYQYKHEEVQFDDNRTTGESQTEDSLDKGGEEYFGADVEEFEGDTWETVEYDGDPIQRREISVTGVTAVSVPADPTDEGDGDLPGSTVQLRLGGGVEHVEHAAVIEAQDPNPQGEEPAGKVSVDDEAE
ncbi:hypothetical protein [Halostella litorea]|uniref:hypothetical protein n=1 Tax=Halostella litorea TaxID=2528831 RepID=UPI001092233D|nr:hypothetical protein [Halostella litorea]